MILPAKHEKLGSSIIVIGGDILALLKDAPRPVEHLYNELNDRRQISLRVFYDALLFLWCCGAVTTTQHTVMLKKPAEAR